MFSTTVTKRSKFVRSGLISLALKYESKSSTAGELGTDVKGLKLSQSSTMK